MLSDKEVLRLYFGHRFDLRAARRFGCTSGFVRRIACGMARLPRRWAIIMRDQAGQVGADARKEAMRDHALIDAALQDRLEQIRTALLWLETRDKTAQIPRARGRKKRRGHS